MNKILLVAFNVLMISVLITCQSVVELSTDISMLKPGDKVGDMVITTGAAKAPPLWAFCATPQEYNDTITLDCEVPPLPKLAIGHTFGVADLAPQTSDVSELTWTLSLDGQLVDLLAFGTFDIVTPGLANHPSLVREAFRKTTVWDVALENPTLGKHILQGSVVANGRTYAWIVNFTVLLAAAISLC